jgi:hypothetical protein
LVRRSVRPTLEVKCTLLDKWMSDHFSGDVRTRHNPAKEIVLSCDPRLGCLLKAG